jgi:hypothetical protein
MRFLNPLQFVGRDHGIQIAPFAELQRINRRTSLHKQWSKQFKAFGGSRFTTTENISYGTYVAMTVTNLQSLANDAADVFAGWQSARVDNFTTTKATDYEVQILLSTAATAPANDQAIYVYVVPWMIDGSSAWTPMANFGTTTRPTGTEGTANISYPNSMKGPIAIPYKITSQPLDVMFTIGQMCGVCPDGWSLALRNCTGAALGTGCVVAYRPILWTNG